MLLETLSTRFRKARAVNQTSNGFVSKVPTATIPRGDANTATGASVFELGGEAGGVTQNSVLILPYGTATDNQTFSMRVIGWRDIVGGETYTVGPDKNLWIPVVLAEYLCTVSSTAPGVAGKTIIAGELFADTIAIVGTTGNANVSMEIVSPAANIIAHVVVSLKGFQKLELSFTTGASATDCNALIALL